MAWARRNIGEAGRFVGRNAQSAAQFVGRNFKSVGNWIGGWFGHKRSQAAPISIPQFQTNGPSPNVGNIGTNNYFGGGNFSDNTLNMRNNFNTRNNTTISLYNQHSVIPANSVGSYDYTGGVLTGVGTGLTAAEIKMFNQNNWFSIKKWTTYSQNFNGNGATGGKVASALKISNRIKWAGRGLGAYNTWSTFDKYSNNKIGTYEFYSEETSNIISTLGGFYGAAWGIGWEGGRAISESDWYQTWLQETWYPYRFKHLGY